MPNLAQESFSAIPKQIEDPFLFGEVSHRTAAASSAERAAAPVPPPQA